MDWGYSLASTQGSDSKTGRTQEHSASPVCTTLDHIYPINRWKDSILPGTKCYCGERTWPGEVVGRKKYQFLGGDE